MEKNIKNMTEEEKEEFLEETLADYRNELNDIHKKRKERSKKRSVMTENELLDSLLNDLKDIEEDAKNNNIRTIPPKK